MTQVYLAYFRRKRLDDDDLIDLLIQKSVQIAIEKEVIQSKSVNLDATHTKSRYNQSPPEEVLRNRSKSIRKTVYTVNEKMKEKSPEKPTEDNLEAELEYSQRLADIIEKDPTLVSLLKIKEPLNLLKETIEDDQLELRDSEDPDARLGHKSTD